MAQPESRLGDRFKLPVVYAGNVDARAEVEAFLSRNCHHPSCRESATRVRGRKPRTSWR